MPSGGEGDVVARYEIGASQRNQIIFCLLNAQSIFTCSRLFEQEAIRDSIILNNNDFEATMEALITSTHA